MCNSAQLCIIADFVAEGFQKAKRASPIKDDKYMTDDYLIPKVQVVWDTSCPICVPFIRRSHCT